MSPSSCNLVDKLSGREWTSLFWELRGGPKRVSEAPGAKKGSKTHFSQREIGRFWRGSREPKNGLSSLPLPLVVECSNGVWLVSENASCGLPRRSFAHYLTHLVVSGATVAVCLDCGAWRASQTVWLSAQTLCLECLISMPRRCQCNW